MPLRDRSRKKLRGVKRQDPERCQPGVAIAVRDHRQPDRGHQALEDPDDALEGRGPVTSVALASTAGLDERYVREWLVNQAAGGYVEYDPTMRMFHLTPEQAFALADPNGPLYLPGAFVLALGALRAEPRITEAFRSGTGMGWHEHDDDVFLGCELLFRPGYVANLVAEWLPALDGVEDVVVVRGPPVPAVVKQSPYRPTRTVGRLRAVLTSQTRPSLRPSRPLGDSAPS